MNDDNLFSDEPSNIFMDFFLYVSLYSIVGNYYGEDHLHYHLTDYPYQNKRTGNYINSDSSDIRYFRIDPENRILFAGNGIYGDHFGLKVRPFQYFYLQSDFFQIIDFDKATDYPSLSVFNVSFCYDRLRFQKINIGWMIGINYVGNRVQRAGFSGGFNLDWFLLKPLSISSSVKWGVNNQKPVDNFELRVRYHYKKVFFSAGYDTLKVYDPRYHFVSAGFGGYL